MATAICKTDPAIWPTTPTAFWAIEPLRNESGESSTMLDLEVGLGIRRATNLPSAMDMVWKYLGCKLDCESTP